MAQSWKLSACLTLVALSVMSGTSQAQEQTAGLTPTSMKWVGRVDERYQSYNIEMLEVTGGRFWKPYLSFDGPHPDPTRQIPQQRRTGR
jgi:heparanase